MLTVSQKSGDKDSAKKCNFIIFAPILLTYTNNL